MWGGRASSPESGGVFFGGEGGRWRRRNNPSHLRVRGPQSPPSLPISPLTSGPGRPGLHPRRCLSRTVSILWSLPGQRNSVRPCRRGPNPTGLPLCSPARVAWCSAEPFSNPWAILWIFIHLFHESLSHSVSLAIVPHVPLISPSECPPTFSRV